MAGRIYLEQMEFHAFHGCYPEEKETGNIFWVDCSFDLADVDGILSDQLEDTIDYTLIYNTIAKEMEKPAQLLEHLAYRIVLILTQLFPEISGIGIKISKLNPPVHGKIKAIAYELRL
jgi:dihydroneopterin aldolase